MYSAVSVKRRRKALGLVCSGPRVVAVLPHLLDVAKDFADPVYKIIFRVRCHQDGPFAALSCLHPLRPFASFHSPMLCPGCEFNYFSLDSGKCHKCKSRVWLSNTEVGALTVSDGSVFSPLTMCVFI